MCVPSASPEKLAGELQLVAVPVSSLQVTLVGALVVVNETLAVEAPITALAAGESIVRVGIVATTNDVEALPTFPTWSVAVTVIV